MRQLQDTLVWLVVVLTIVGAFELSMVNWKSSRRDLLEPGQTERSAMLDLQLEEIQARNPELFVDRDQQ
jgi:hypothetical protein